MTHGRLQVTFKFGLEMPIHTHTIWFFGGISPQKCEAVSTNKSVNRTIRNDIVNIRPFQIVSYDVLWKESDKVVSFLHTRSTS